VDSVAEQVLLQAKLLRWQLFLDKDLKSYVSP
jgi:hypothetical protein